MTVVYLDTCESKADSTSLVSWSLCLKRHAMGLDLTYVLLSLVLLKEVKLFAMPSKCVKRCQLHSALS